ncbi:MAG: hypothetical protein BWX88_04850 [Planctomycetes bacterium ADurb.Bin126]|nr:MAG: hypothetical protein BWX88_04850 [Planctomycetes bacterium ADurb.Bin126]HOD83835.1 hypothetical protein [Phycisphaerae bacterium]HQL74320.1 hypothetical protein [Phycisphaerae bacterium]
MQSNVEAPTAGGPVVLEDGGPDGCPARVALRLALAVGAVVFIWSMILSAFLGAHPGAPLLRSNDALFSLDVSSRTTRLTTFSFSTTHPLMGTAWAVIGWTLRRGLGLFMEDRQAAVVGCRIIMAATMAIAWGALFYVARRLGASLSRLLVLLPVSLLFTANTIAVLPDVYGLSMFTLSLTVLPMALDWSGSRKLWFLLLVVFLSSGTTLTNGILPMLLLVYETRRQGYLTWAWCRRHSRPLLAILAAVVLTLAVTGKTLFRRATEGDTVLNRHWNLTLVKEPTHAALHLLMGLTYPAVGPETLEWGEGSKVSYSLWHLDQYGLFSGLAAAVWTALLAMCLTVFFRDRKLSAFGFALAAWYLFNVLFYNLWGNEFFLYSINWSWAIVLVLLVGSRKLPVKVLAPAAAVICVGQVVTIVAIARAVAALG